MRRLEEYFEFARLGTSWRQEALAGLTTFLTMAYIIFVNPSILADAGMPAAAVTAATCISAGLASILMGAVARYPIAMAPGMGLNAYFTYGVVKGMGVAWQTALGAVFLSGVLFLLLTVTGVRRWIVEAIPRPLYSATAVGIGLFIALIGLKNAGVVVASPATLLTLGNLRTPATALALGGLLVTAALLILGVRAAILIGVGVTTAAASVMGLTHMGGGAPPLQALAQTAFQLDIAGAMRLGVAEIVFAFLFVDLFDNLGTLLAVTTRAGLVGADGRIPRIERILAADSVATMAGAVAGTSTVVSYIESAAGVAAGGRSGVTAIVTGLLFLASLFLAPLVGVIPAAATAPALILVGALMMAHTAEIAWDDLRVAIPAFLTIVAIPMTFSIANGLSLGFISYALLEVLTGRGARGFAVCLCAFGHPADTIFLPWFGVMRLLLLLFPALLAGAEWQLDSVTKIWDQPKHAAFGDITRWHDRWYVVFREGQGHAPSKGKTDDGKLRVLSSADRTAWQSEALLEEAGVDLRDPHLSVTPKKQLMIVAGGSYYPDGVYKSRQSRVFFSKNGRAWTAPVKVVEDTHWLWRVTWHKGVAYGVSKYGSPSAELATNPRKVRLVRSKDGAKWETITELQVPGGDETAVRFLADGTMVALTRRTWTDGNIAWVGTSKAPYKEWSWKPAGPLHWRAECGHSSEWIVGRGRTDFCGWVWEGSADGDWRVDARWVYAEGATAERRG